MPPPTWTGTTTTADVPDRLRLSPSPSAASRSIRAGGAHLPPGTAPPPRPVDRRTRLVARVSSPEAHGPPSAEVDRRDHDHRRPPSRSSRRCREARRTRLLRMELGREHVAGRCGCEPSPVLGQADGVLVLLGRVRMDEVEPRPVGDPLDVRVRASPRDLVPSDVWHLDLWRQSARSSGEDAQPARGLPRCARAAPASRRRRRRSACRGRSRRAPRCRARAT